MKSFDFLFESGWGELLSKGHLRHRCVASCDLDALACVGDSSVPRLATKLPLARIMYFAEQVSLANTKVLPASQGNSGRPEKEVLRQLLD